MGCSGLESPIPPTETQTLGLPCRYLSVMGSKLKELHDELLASKPADVEHDEATCPLCKLESLTANQETTTDEHLEGGAVTTTDTSFTQEQVDAKVDEAVTAAKAELQAQLDQLQAQAMETEVGKAVAEAVAAKDTEIAELTTSLDEATVKLGAAEQLATDTHAFFAEAIEADQAAWDSALRKDGRLEALRKVSAKFDDEYLAEHGDRFAAMTDEDFAARLEEYTKLGVAPEAGAGGFIPAQTAMTDARTAGEGSDQSGSALAALPLLRRGALGDPRTL